MKITYLQYGLSPSALIEIEGLRILVDCPLNRVLADDVERCYQLQPDTQDTDHMVKEQWRTLLEKVTQREAQEVPVYHTLSPCAVDVATLDVILVSSSAGILGLPQLLLPDPERPDRRFKGAIYATEAAIRLARARLAEMEMYELRRQNTLVVEPTGVPTNAVRSDRMNESKGESMTEHCSATIKEWITQMALSPIQSSTSQPLPNIERLAWASSRPSAVPSEREALSDLTVFGTPTSNQLIATDQINYETLRETRCEYVRLKSPYVNNILDRIQVVLPGPSPIILNTDSVNVYICAYDSGYALGSVVWHISTSLRVTPSAETTQHGLSEIFQPHRILILTSFSTATKRYPAPFQLKQLQEAGVDTLVVLDQVFGVFAETAQSMPVPALQQDTSTSLYQPMPISPPEIALNRLWSTAEKILTTGGSVLIPGLMLDTWVDVIQFLNTALLAKGLPHVPIYVVSPSARGLLAVYAASSTNLSSSKTAKAFEGSSPFPFGAMIEQGRLILADSLEDPILQLEVGEAEETRAFVENALGYSHRQLIARVKQRQQQQLQQNQNQRGGQPAGSHEMLNLDDPLGRVSNSTSYIRGPQDTSSYTSSSGSGMGGSISLRALGMKRGPLGSEPSIIIAEDIALDQGPAYQLLRTWVASSSHPKDEVQAEPRNAVIFTDIALQSMRVLPSVIRKLRRELSGLPVFRAVEIPDSQQGLESKCNLVFEDVPLDSRPPARQFQLLLSAIRPGSVVLPLSLAGTLLCSLARAHTDIKALAALPNMVYKSISRLTKNPTGDAGRLANGIVDRCRAALTVAQTPIERAWNLLMMTSLVSSAQPAPILLPSLSRASTTPLSSIVESVINSTADLPVEVAQHVSANAADLASLCGELSRTLFVSAPFINHVWITTPSCDTISWPLPVPFFASRMTVRLAESLRPRPFSGFARQGSSDYASSTKQSTGVREKPVSVAWVDAPGVRMGGWTGPSLAGAGRGAAMGYAVGIDTADVIAAVQAESIATPGRKDTLHSLPTGDIKTLNCSLQADDDDFWSDFVTDGTKEGYNESGDQLGDRRRSVISAAPLPPLPNEIALQDAPVPFLIWVPAENHERLLPSLYSGLRQNGSQAAFARMVLAYGYNRNLIASALVAKGQTEAEAEALIAELDLVCGRNTSAAYVIIVNARIVIEVAWSALGWDGMQEASPMVSEPPEPRILDDVENFELSALRPNRELLPILVSIHLLPTENRVEQMTARKEVLANLLQPNRTFPLQYTPMKV